MLLADELKAATEAAIGRARHRAMESVEICKQLDLRGTSHLVKFIRESVRAAQGKQRVAIKKETREIYARNVGNPNRDGVQHQILGMRRRLIDENAAEIFSIYCEAWTLAGKKKSAAFIRFVRDARILPLITSQSNGVLPYLRSSALRARTKQRVLPASFGMLRTEWHDKLETEALKVELLDSAQSDVNLLANRHPVTERRSPDATFAGQAAPVDGQNGGGARQSLAAAREDAPATPLKAGKDTSIYVGRAMLIEKIRREIVEISQKIELGEDYDIMIRDSSVFAGYITVVVCNRQPALCDKLCLIGTTKKPRIIDLACEIASHTSNGSDAKPLLPKTYHDAHKRYGSEARRRLAQRQ